VKKTLLFIVLFLLSTLRLAQSADKDTLVIALTGDATTLDPHNHMEIITGIICDNIFDTLLQRTADLKIEPHLATSYRLVNETTWEFSLRKGVKFHNGELFSAESAKFSLERLANPQNKLRSTILQVIDRVDIVDDYCVRIITKHPHPYLDALLSIAGGMIPPKYAKEKGPRHISMNPVGTGPYTFIRWLKDDQIVLQANENYWGGSPKIKKVIFRPVPDTSARVAGLQTEELDLIAAVPPNLEKTISSRGKTLVSKVPSIRLIYVAFDNTKGGPVADKRVRQAVAQAIDLDLVIKNILQGNAIKLGSPLPKEFFGHDPEVKPHPYDPNMSRQLLADAGHGQGLDLTINYRSDAANKEIVEAVAGFLKKVGINTTMKGYEYGTFISLAYGHNLHPAYLFQNLNGTFDPDATLFYVLRSGQVWTNFTNPRMDALIDRARITMDKETRRKIYSEVCNLYKEEVPWAFCYQQIDVYGANERLNWTPRADGRLFAFDMSFKR
jgi:peptide/nickel transport system substrate-binding protein